MRSPWLPALLWLLPTTAAAQSTQSFQVIAETARPTVGDTVTLRFRVRLDERDLLIDTVPRPIGPVPGGVRLLSVEKLRRTPDRIFHGKARLAFYRPGRQPVPVFGLPFMRIVEGLGRATLPSDSAYVTVAPVLPAGNPALKDIREIEPPPAFPWSLLAAGVLLAITLLVLHRRRRRLASRSAPAEKLPEVQASAAPSDPFDIALDALLAIERERLPERGEVPRHYERVVDVLRDYLHSVASIPAREQTTAELLWALPPHLSENGGEQCRELLLEADLVKFARVRPDVATAHEFVVRSRLLLNRWHSAGVPDEAIDALR